MMSNQKAEVQKAPDSMMHLTQTGMPGKDYRPGMPNLGQIPQMRQAQIAGLQKQMQMGLNPAQLPGGPANFQIGNIDPEKFMAQSRKQQVPTDLVGAYQNIKNEPGVATSYGNYI